MAVFLGFLKNSKSEEEFVAPVDADNRMDAELALAEQYPRGPYQLLTIYEKREIEHVLSGLTRWPGLPSKVQPPLEQMVSRVKVGIGKLPPLPNQQPANQQSIMPQADSARVEQVRHAAQGINPEVQALAARLLAAGIGRPVPEIARPAVHPVVREVMQAEQPLPANRPTIFEALKNLRS